MENSNKRKERVIPGDELAVIEEYESGKGTHIIDGQIHASVFGKTKFDNKFVKNPTIFKWFCKAECLTRKCTWDFVDLLQVS